MSQLRSARGRAGVAMLDQGVSSLGNIALTIVVACSVPLADFGRYALVLAAYQIIVAVSQTLTGEPLLVLAGGSSARQVRGAAGLALALGVGGGAAIALAAAVAPIDTSLLALGVLLPGLLLQDCLRYVAFARRRPLLALASDTLWTVTQLLATLAVVESGHAGVRDLVLAWGAPASLAAVVLLLTLAVVPRPGDIRLWAHSTRHLGHRYLGETVSTSAAVQVTLYLTGALAGVGAVGQLRLAQVLFGPLHVLFAGIRSFGVPEASRRIADGHDCGGLVRVLAVLLGSAATLWTVALAITPGRLGTALLGSTWVTASGVIWIVGIQKTLECVSAGPFLVHRASLRASWTLRVRVVSALVTLIAVTAAAPRFGARGAAFGMLLGSAVAAAAWWFRYLVEDSRSGRVAPPAAEPPLCHVVSHAYLEPEVAKNLTALGGHLRVTLVTPRTSPVLVFPQRSVEPGGGAGYEVLPFARHPRQGPIYVLRSLRLGMNRRPRYVVVEYDPWLPIFWQCLLAAKLFGRSAVYLAVKKNTFRRRPRRVATLKRLLARLGLRHVEGVMATSHMVARLYERELGYPRERIFVVPQFAVDTVAFRPPSDRAAPDRGMGAIRIGFVGRVSRRKGVDTLLRSFALVRDSVPGAELHLMGPLDPSMADTVGTAGGSVHLHEPVANGQVADFLRTLDIFVMPSAKEADHEEHDGQALLEAMATGLPCVGSDSGITPELLCPDNGLVFHAGDHLELAGQILRLVTDPGLRARIAANAREFVEGGVSLLVVANTRVAVITADQRREVVPV